MMTKGKRIYSTLLATFMVFSFSGIALADDLNNINATDDTGYEEPAQIDRAAMIEELVVQWTSDDTAAYQLSGMLEKADDSKLLAAWQAESLAEINTILRGTTALEGTLVLGDLDMDYTFTPVTPCRIVDTRIIGGMLAAGIPRQYFVYGPGSTMTSQGGNGAGCPSPVDEPRAVLVNVTAFDPVANGHLRAYAADVTTPTTSLVNYTTGVTIANAAAVKTLYGAGEELAIYSSAGSHLIIDVMGYYDVPTISAGVEYVGGDQHLTLSSTADIPVRAISVDVPTQSYCAVNASANILVAAAGLARCSITTGTTLEESALVSVGNNGTDSLYQSYAATRGYSQPAGSTIYRLVCDSDSGSHILRDSHLTAVCTRNRY